MPDTYISGERSIIQLGCARINLYSVKMKIFIHIWTPAQRHSSSIFLFVHNVIDDSKRLDPNSASGSQSGDM